MAGDVTIVKPDAPMAQRIQAAAIEAETFVRDVASPACGRFYRFFEELAKHPSARAVLSLDPTWPEFGQKVDNLRAEIEALAKAIAGLDGGQLELVGWVRGGNDRGTIPVIAVAPAGKFQQVEVGFAIAPVLVVLAVGAAAVGVFVLADLYLSARYAAQQADLVRAQTEARLQDAIVKAPADQRAALVDAMTRARAAANDTAPSWLSTFGKNLAALASDVVNATGSMLRVFTEQNWPWLLVLAIALSGRGRRRRA